MNTDKKPAKQYFQVQYAWTKGGQEHHGRTVVTAKSQYGQSETQNGKWR